MPAAGVLAVVALPDDLAAYARWMEERVVRAVDATAGRVEVVVRFSVGPPSRVEVVMPSGGVVSGVAVDVFYALIKVREQLEPGLQLCCNGARVDVWPSGMSGQMSGGLVAYLRPADRQPGKDDLVDIFDPAPCDIVGSVEAQRAALKAPWLRRPLGRRR